MKNYLLYLFILISTLAKSQPLFTWQKCLGGTEGDDAYFLIETHDHGYLVAGSSNSIDGDIINSHGGSDAFLVRFDSNNNIVWKKNYGGTQDDGFGGIIETSDHGFMIAGSTESNDGDVVGNHGSNDVWVMKVDSLGNLIWQKTYGGSDFDQVFSIIKNASGNFIISGYTQSIDGDVTFNHGNEDYWLLEIDSLGNLIWQKTYGGSDTDWGYQVIQTNDGGYIISGLTYSNDGDVNFNCGTDDVWLVKTDSSGNLLWQKTYGGTDEDFSDNIAQLPNGKFVFAACTNSSDGDVTTNNGDYDYWVVKTDINGALESEKCFGGTDWEEPHYITQTSDGGFAITGATMSNDGDVSINHGDVDCWTLKLDSNCNKEWQLCSGGSNEDNSYCVRQLADGEFALAGYTYSNDGDVFGNHGNGFEDMWIFKISTAVNVLGSNSKRKIQIYPNPCNSIIYIDAGNYPTKSSFLIRILDVFGNIVLQTVSSAQKIFLDIGRLEGGAYIIEFNDGNIKRLDRIVKLD